MAPDRRPSTPSTPATPRVSWLDRLTTSPLAVAGASFACIAAWSSAYRGAAEAEPRPAAPAAVASTTSDVPIPPARPHRVSPTAFPRAVPRLRAPYEARVPGVEIALQDADGHSMDALHAALRRARDGEGQARLTFYGASHTAADLYTGLLRRTLQGAYGDAGHGFVLPVQPWRGYSHQGVRVARMSADWRTVKVGTPTVGEDHYGLAGVAVESDVADARAYVETAPSGTGSHASRFELFFLRQPGGGGFDVFVDGRQHGSVATVSPRREAGYYTVETSDGPHRVEVRLHGTGVVRLFGVAVGREAPGVVVDVHGINGHRARNQLFWDETLHREHLRRRRPDLVALAYGTNEAGDDAQPIEAYEALLRQVVGRVREAAPQASCLLIGPSDRPVEGADGQYVDRPRTAAIIEVQWRVALEHGCAFFDTVAFQGGSMATVAWAAMEPPYAGRDHVHFTRLGYERMGEVLLGAMLEGSGLELPSMPAPAPSDASEPEGL